MNIRLNTTTFACLFALIGGLAATALPWGVNYQDLNLIGVAIRGNLSVTGSNVPHAGAIGVTLLVVLLYLIATNPLQPPPVWRTVGTVILTLIAGVIFLLYGYGPGGYWIDFAGPWVTILSLLALLITATLELHITFTGRAAEKPGA